MLPVHSDLLEQELQSNSPWVVPPNPVRPYLIDLIGFQHLQHNTMLLTDSHPAWDVRNSCKHNGAVLPVSAAPVGRGADGVDALA
jgi:hypothetical protein